MKKKLPIMNKKDRDLLIILVSLVIGALIYFFLIRPAYEQRQQLQQQKQDLQAEQEYIQTAKTRLSSLRASENELRNGLKSKYDIFFSELRIENILNHLDLLIGKTQLSVISFVPAGPVVARIPVPGTADQTFSYPLLDLASEIAEGKRSEKVQTGDRTASDTILTADAVPAMSVSIIIGASSYESVMAFIRELESMKKAVVIESITLSAAEEGLAGQLTISLYSLPRPSAEEKDAYAFQPSLPKGRYNPFK